MCLCLITHAHREREQERERERERSVSCASHMACVSTEVGPRATWDMKKECSNCGETLNLMLCSRCKSAYFCSASCQKAYWPFHKTECRKNEFADAIEHEDPKFARWMRRHRKLAVLKDDEVDRLERAQHASIGPSREEVMESMYGRLNPKPIEPSYTPEELRKMEQLEEDEKRRKMLVSERDRRWTEVQVDRQLGLDCSSAHVTAASEKDSAARVASDDNSDMTAHGAAPAVIEALPTIGLPYKWDQNQAFVEVYVQLPKEIHPSAYRDVVQVVLTPTSVDIYLRDDRGGVGDGTRKLWGGTIFAEIKVDESTWLIRDGIVEMTLLKRSRRGCYANGHTNADTFWYAVFRDARMQERISADAVPSAYYKSYFESDTKELHRLRGKAGYTPMISSKGKQ